MAATSETSAIEASWIESRRLVDEQLAAYVALGPDCPDRLREAMKYSLLAGGKRLRPLLVLLACEACGGSQSEALPAACAIEMVHTYSLVHDDLPAMDDDDLRRGRPTSHVQFDESTAILAGDALLTYAFEILAGDVRPTSAAAACCAELAAAAGPTGMVGGQMADLLGESCSAPTVELLRSIHRRKTGRLLCCAVVLGGLCGGADETTLETLRTYGLRVGLAFQIADDLLDVAGERDRMGKAVGKDAEHGKLTFPALLGETESRREARRLVDEACEATASLGERGQRLNALAHFVLQRDH